MIKVFIPTPLRKFTADQSSVEVSAGTVGEAIQRLGQHFPELNPYLFDQDGHIRKFVRVFIGDQDMHQLDGEQTTLKSGDEVSIIPAIAGGREMNFRFSIFNCRGSLSSRFRVTGLKY